MSAELNIEQNQNNESILTINGLKVSFGMREIFENLDLTIRKGEKIALVGPNGAGKTTLIKAIMGISEFDSGKISKKKEILISYVPQSSDDIKLDPNSTIEECVTKVSGMEDLSLELQKTYQQLEKKPSDTGILIKLGELQTTFENRGGYRILGKTKEILSGIGISDLDFNSKFSVLSGGEKMKTYIAIALAMEPDLLILDEPTNNIDRRSLDWLGNFLSNYKQSVLVVSHDPNFLDRFVKRVIEISPERARTVEYTGNYSEFLQKKQQIDEFKLKELDKLREQQENAERIGNKLKAGSQAGVGKGRLVRAERLREIVETKEGEMSTRSRKMEIDFSLENLGPKTVLVASGVVVDLGNKMVDFSKLDIEIDKGQRWEVSGATGSGKSILLEAIVGNLKFKQGDILINEGVNIGYFSQKHEDLNPKNNLIQEIHSVNSGLSIERTRSILGHFLFTGDDHLKNIKVLSQGERSRLVLAKLFVGNHNLLILDEPTSHLDVSVREQLIGALKSYNGTIIAVSNDRAFLEKIGIDHQLSLPNCEVSFIY